MLLLFLNAMLESHNLVGKADMDTDRVMLSMQLIKILTYYVNMINVGACFWIMLSDCRLI